MVSPALLEELKTIMLEDYQIDLAPEEVVQLANTLIGYAETLARIDHEGGQQNKS